jgi:hypothetical protein
MLKQAGTMGTTRLENMEFKFHKTGLAQSAENKWFSSTAMFAADVCADQEPLVWWS